MLTEQILQCPYGGESFDTLVDTSSGSQHYIEDCQVCCRPIEVYLETDPHGTPINVRTRRDDD